jgi:hypothetical protein
MRWTCYPALKFKNTTTGSQRPKQREPSTHHQPDGAVGVTLGLLGPKKEVLAWKQKKQLQHTYMSCPGEERNTQGILPSLAYVHFPPGMWVVTRSRSATVSAGSWRKVTNGMSTLTSRASALAMTSSRLAPSAPQMVSSDMQRQKCQTNGAPCAI